MVDNSGNQGPHSLDSEYDEYLAIEVDLDSPVNNSLTDNKDKSWTLPYSGVYNNPTKFKAFNRNIFIPNEEIQVRIVSYERSLTTHLLYPNLYTIELKHGTFKWIIRKRYKHILHLHQQLRIYRASLSIPFPTKSHKERRLSFKNEIHSGDTTLNRKMLPRFPAKPEALVPFEKIEYRMKQLEQYLQNLLKINLYRSHQEIATFFEVSELSFIKDLGLKGKEGMLLKRSRSSHPANTGCNCCGLLDSGVCVRCHYVCSDLCSSWRSRWIIIKESFIAYINPNDGQVKAVMLFDSGLEVSSGIFSTGLRNGLHIVNLSRQLICKCPTRRIAQEWLQYIKECIRKEGSDFIQRNRYYSFTPERQSIRATWLVDGLSYMSAVADALEEAREEIFIADWWLSPEIYLKRPASLHCDYWRLDTILRRKSKQGVKIFILLYKEVEMALGINSYYSKQRLSDDNIKILRHPDHAKAGVYLWAHHEKVVVIDQSVGFVGGIDLCYGRWDDYSHRLTDLGSVLKKESVSSFEASSRKLSSVCGDVIMMPSPDNIKCDTPEVKRKTILSTVRSCGKDLMSMVSIIQETNEEFVFPLNDSSKITNGNITIEKNDGKETNNEDLNVDKVVDVTDGLKIESIENENNDSTNCVWLDVIDSIESRMPKLWIGKDYCNFIFKDFISLDQPFQDFVNRNTTPRMPWHDVGVMVKGSAARDIARHFIQRWNSTKTEKAKMNNQYPYLFPKSYCNIDYQYLTNLNSTTHRVSCQVLRSISHWSGGYLDVLTWEGSIHEAYVDVIAKALHFIYIENQFFISLSSPQVKNQVSDALFRRILRAHRENTEFRVYIIIPLLPGFEGEIGTSSGTALHAITHWNYASLCRGKDSLIFRLKEAGIENPFNYITFNSLRKHAVLFGQPITELIYVHSKLLIADDRVVICGSANINDRSLLGRRDSEIAVILQDEEFILGRMNNEIVCVGKFAGSLRKYLFQEHLGLLDNEQNSIDVEDPVISTFYNDTWKKIAQSNTEIYEEVFHCIPSDKVKNFNYLKKYTQEPTLVSIDIHKAKSVLTKIRGHLVNLPIEFLCDESLTPGTGSVEGLMPTSLWT